MTESQTVERVDDYDDPVKAWMSRIELAKKNEEDWNEEADACNKAYYAQDGQQFSIFWSNIQTIQPNLYSNTPRPDVRRRFADTDPAAREASQVLERAIEIAMDEYDFDAEADCLTLDALVEGRGVPRVRHIRYMNDDESGSQAYECVRMETVPRKQFLRGPGKYWRDVPWIGYIHEPTRDELVKKFGSKGKKIPLLSEVEPDKKAETDKREDDVLRVACVYEIWDKDSRTVIWLAEGYDDIIQTDPDPHGLVGFFDCPMPYYAIAPKGSLVPVPEYRYYKEQAEELDNLTERINVLTGIIKAAGFYNGAMRDGIESLIDVEDGRLYPVDGNIVGSLTQSIVWMPIDQIVNVRTQLEVSREQVKATIYEITGISDILRGASDAGETARAQSIKAQYGGLRLNKRQRAVQRVFRDIMRIKAEIIAEKYQPETLNMIMGKEVSPEALALLKNDVLRGFRIDIETDSTVAGDNMTMMENMGSFVDGIARFAAAVGPMVQAGQMPQDVAVTMFKGFVRNFKLGKEVENAIETMGQEGTPEAQIQMLTQQLAQAQQQMQAMQEELKKIDQAKVQSEQARAQADMMRAQADSADKQAGTELEARKIKLDEEKLALERDKFSFEKKIRTAELRLEAETESARTLVALEGGRAREKPKEEEDERKEAAGGAE